MRSGGFTTQTDRALRDGAALEPEAVPAEYGDRLADQAHLDAARAREEFRLSLNGNSLDHRLRVAIATAKDRKVDIHQPLRLCRLAMQSGRSEAAVTRRVEAIEQKLYPPLN